MAILASLPVLPYLKYFAKICTYFFYPIWHFHNELDLSVQYNPLYPTFRANIAKMRPKIPEIGPFLSENPTMFSNYAQKIWKIQKGWVR